MRIIVDNGTYHLTNLGDVAMLQVAVSRLRALFPDADIHVISQAPHLLQKFCPGTHAVSPVGRDRWFGAGIAMGALKSRLPGPAKLLAHEAEQWVKHTSPNLLVSWRKRRDTDGGRSAMLMKDFVKLVESSD